MRAASIRVRLTLWYGGMVLLAGFLLVSINFVLTSRNFPTSGDQFREDVASRLGLPPEALARDESIRLNPRPRGGGGRTELSFLAGEFLDDVREQLRTETLEELVIQSSVAMLLLAIASGGIGWWIAGRALRPITDITATARRISEQRLGERVDLRGPPDELQELADQFDVMLDRIEGSFEAQRAFVSNASHELRTPLAIMRTELDVTTAGPATAEQWRASADVLRRAVDRSEALIDGLLVLARADSPRSAEERLDLGELARSSLAAHRAAADERGITPSVETSTVELVGDRVLLERLVDNLIDNGIRHNVDGGRLEISVAADGDDAVLLVENGGPVIPEAEVAALFERFARGADATRTRSDGYGLGLAIVRAVAHHHTGTASARPLPGGGLRVEVRLPRAP
jgi:signal transduction histidine kinase